MIDRGRGADERRGLIVGAGLYMLPWLWGTENHILRERGKGVFLSPKSEPRLLERRDDER